MTEQPGLVYRVGLQIVHPGKPEWGPGRILAVEGNKIKVYFRDLPGEAPESAVRTLDTRYVKLERATEQSDPFLDNLPPYSDGGFQRPTKGRLTIEEGIETFRAYCPLLFEDPAYIGDLKEGERVYKWKAHEQYVATLGDGLKSLLLAGEIDELRRRSFAVESRTNLLAVFEKAAFRDGLRDAAAAERYFVALEEILAAPEIEQQSFQKYLHAVESLPSETGKTSPAKWTVATILPFLAQPDRFMFLKPQVTLDCAARLTFDLQYSTELNWLTYSKLLTMSTSLLDMLEPLGARDFIDVQSFIWLIGLGRS